MSIIERAVRRLKAGDVEDPRRKAEPIEESRPPAAPPTPRNMHPKRAPHRQAVPRPGRTTPGEGPYLTGHPTPVESPYVIGRATPGESPNVTGRTTPVESPYVPGRATPLESPYVTVRATPREGPYGTIDLERLESAGVISPDGRRSQVSEEFRAIKRTLLENAKRTDFAAGGNSNLIVVTSAFPNEGKTFSAINLAVSISLEFDHRVLLVDADVVQPRRRDFLGLRLGKGLMDLLLDPALSLDETVIRTNVERLSVLLAGPPHQQANEILASEGMTRRLKELAVRGPGLIVIFDAPPLLVTTEAGILAQRAGQVVMVVEVGRTTQAAVKSALTHLEGCNVFGLLNKGTRRLGEGLHDYSRYGDPR